MKGPVVAAFLLCASADVANAATKIAVIELGKGGAVRRTSSKYASTTVDGVASFWSALHAPGRKLQHAGMTVVPDLFSRPDGSLVLGLAGSGMDLDAMPTLGGLVSEEGARGVVGHMDIDGPAASLLMNKVPTVNDVEPSNLSSRAHQEFQEPGLSGLKMSVNSLNAVKVDEQVGLFIEAAHKEALEMGRKLVLHLVVEEEAGAARRRLLARRLNDEEEGEEEEAEDNGDGDNGDEGNGDNGNGNNANNNGQQQNQNGYYGYGYYNAFGEWVTPYKTMFQIQYFNVVLWTSVGLTLVLFFTIYLMMYMPLEADTLLFGEAAKMMGDD